MTEVPFASGLKFEQRSIPVSKFAFAFELAHCLDDRCDWVVRSSVRALED
jgi:hypothetical protein